MAKNSAASIWWIIFNVAVGAFLAIGGINALNGGGDQAAAAVGSLLGSQLFVTVFGVIELISGIFIILQTFIGDKFGKLDEILKLVVVIVWAIAIVAKDIINPGLNGLVTLGGLYVLAQDLIVLTALLISRS